MLSRIYERVGTDKLFKSEVNIMKRVLKDIIRLGKINTINWIYDDGLEVYNIPIWADIPIIYSGEVVSYDMEDYLMVGMTTQGFSVDWKKFPEVVQEHLFLDVKNILTNGRYFSGIDGRESLKKFFPEIYYAIDGLGMLSNSSFTTEDISDIVKSLYSDYKFEIKNIDRLNNIKIEWARHKNGLGIKSDTFIPCLFLDKNNYKLYYFDMNNLTLSFYYLTIPKLIHRDVLKEVRIDNINSLKNIKGGIGSPTICLSRSFG